MVGTASNPFYLTSLRPPEGEATMDLKSSGRNFKSIILLQTEGSFKDKILGICEDSEELSQVGYGGRHFNIGYGEFEVTSTKRECR